MMKRRSAWQVMTLVAVVAAGGGRALGCLNDSGSEAAEAEFRSRYDRPAAPRARALSSGAVAAATAGLLMTGVAVGLRLRRPSGKVRTPTDATAKEGARP